MRRFFSPLALFAAIAVTFLGASGAWCELADGLEIIPAEGDLVGVTGGNWRIEYEDGLLEAFGEGEITITWGEGVSARASRVELRNPPLSAKLSGGVSVSYYSDSLESSVLTFDSEADLMAAEGDVVAVFDDPPIKIESERAVYYGVADRTPDARVVFDGSVNVFTPHDGLIVTDEVVYLPESGIISIPGAFSGSFVFDFIEDPDHPFYGERAEIEGDSFSAVLDDEGYFSEGAAAATHITTESSGLSAPLLYMFRSGAGSTLILQADGERRVSGYFTLEDGQRAAFECGRLEVSEKSGRVKLSGDVKVNSEGLEFLSELLFLTREGEFWVVESARRTEINLEDLRIE